MVLWLLFIDLLLKELMPTSNLISWIDQKGYQTILILGVPEKLEVYYQSNAYKYADFSGTYFKDGWEVFGYPVFRKTDANKDYYLFYRNMEGYWCFVIDGKVHKSQCHTSNAVKNGKFPIIPPEQGWTYTYNKQNKPVAHMRVVSHWWENRIVQNCLMKIHWLQLNLPVF